jgi:hypothetical protein
MNITSISVVVAVAMVLSAPVRIITNLFIGSQEAGIVVHSLTYVNDGKPVIVQDRTVTAEHSLVANWTAYVRGESDPIEAPESERICHGSGWWNYSSSRKSAIIEFDDWVGEIGCFDKLPRSEVIQVCATYSWGDGSKTQQCSNGFKIDKTAEK